VPVLSPAPPSLPVVAVAAAKAAPSFAGRTTKVLPHSLQQAIVALVAAASAAAAGATTAAAATEATAVAPAAVAAIDAAATEAATLLEPAGACLCVSGKARHSSIPSPGQAASKTAAADALTEKGGFLREGAPTPDL
jgi:hypothetical protein